MVQTLRIARINFRAGSAPGQPALEIDCPNVTVLVGPNSSGKSRTLIEIENECKSAEPIKYILIDGVSFILPDNGSEINTMLNPFRMNGPPQGHTISPGHDWLTKPKINDHDEIRLQVDPKSYDLWLKSKSTESIARNFIRFFTTRLDGKTRFGLVQQKPTGELDQYPQNHLWSLFIDDSSREKVRKFTEEAFKKHFVIDPTGMTSFRIRLSERRPRSKIEEQALDHRARKFHSDAPMITELGDGVQASVGLVAAVMSLPDRILLIDEPEAFLHPTLARRLGRVLAQTARDRDASLIVSTHSSEFLLGSMQSTPELRIVRLTYEEGVPSARSIDPAGVQALIADPLLRSAHAMRALFHRAVVISEADADRAFYEEINSRLSVCGNGVEDALFMNAQNWQTIHRLVVPLRTLGIPAAAIYDFDVLMDDDFSHIWGILFETDKPAIQNLMSDRDKVRIYMGKAGRPNCKSKGLDALSGEERAMALHVISAFSSYGIYFVPVGELECWLPEMGVSRSNKAKWLVRIFERMGNNPSDPSYAQPTTEGVWSFIEQITMWVNDAARKGIPR